MDAEALQAMFLHLPRSRREPSANDYQSVERRRAFGLHDKLVDIDLGYFGNALHQPADREHGLCHRRKVAPALRGRRRSDAWKR